MPEYITDIASVASILSLFISGVTLITTCGINKTVKKEAKMIAYRKECNEIIDTLSFYVKLFEEMDKADNKQLTKLQGELTSIKTKYNILLDKKLTENVDRLSSNIERYMLEEYGGSRKRECYRELIELIELLRNLL